MASSNPVLGAVHTPPSRALPPFEPNTGRVPGYTSRSAQLLQSVTRSQRVVWSPETGWIS